jgi:polysaccharide deacetylase family protein (PEP-CTERM system associated)
MNNILTCDLEDWYHASLMNSKFEEWDQYQQCVVRSTRKILDILDRTNTKITFFILGWIAERYPSIVETIYKAGHEIASHGYRHQLIYHLSPEEFNEDLKKSIHILSSVCGKKINGFRAPSWSINSRTHWAFTILAQNEILYDSSLFPFKTFLYGDNRNPRFSYNVTVDSKREIIEIPASAYELFGKRIPFSGGFYLRLIPYPLLKEFINSYNNNNQPAIIYFHPWEIDPDFPRIELSYKNRFIQYYNITVMEKKLKQLLKDYEFVSISQYFKKLKMKD